MTIKSLRDYINLIETAQQGVAEATGLYGPFTVTINTGERPQSRTKTKKFRREDDAILWAEDWLEDAPQYVFATAEVTDPDGNVVWTTDEQGVAEGSGGAQYKIKSIGRDSKGDYYISPSTGKKVYKSGVKRGDHENPKTGEHKSVAEGDVDEAKYQGREVPLGKKMAGDVKKSKVYVRKPNGNIVKVNFGDKKMRIKKSNPARRKSFRARHNCANPGPRHKARYWSCRSW